jgi:SAM-dependent methyltransferase
VVRGCPILFKRDGLFTAAGATEATAAGFTAGAIRRMARYLPSPSFTYFAAKAKERAIRMHAGEQKTCLVIGAGDNEVENRRLAEAFGTVVITDVAVRDGLDVVCDGHDLPFADDQFDFVMMTAVLEHVVSPSTVVAEVSRVLKPGGGVYAVTPFMQQVHMGAYDFQRFTDLGHRWLFRNFEEIERGTCGGPASSLVWSLIYLAASMSSNRSISRLLGLIARVCFSWIKVFDFVLERGRGARDAANGFYFIGRNRKAPVLTERELIDCYVGRNR